MIIAFNTRVLPDDYPEEYWDFICETINRIISKNPDHRFIIITYKKVINDFSAAPNMQLVVSGAISQRPLIWKFWVNVKLKALLKKHKADILVSFDGVSLSSNLPQCMVLQHLYSEEDKFLKKSQQKFYKKLTPKFLNKASAVAVTSEFLKKKIIEHYHKTPSEISVVHGGADEKFIPVSMDERQMIKNKYTEGKDFFLYTGSINSSKNVVSVLKAFSVFKKRQQTNMKLLLAGKVSKNFQSFKENLQSYKYKRDVVLLENTEKPDLIKITGTALAFVDASHLDCYSSSVIQTARCNVPVMIDKNSPMQEILHDAALYFDSENYKDIADKMMQIYKDENLQKQLINKTEGIANNYNWDKTAGLIWQSIFKAIR